MVFGFLPIQPIFIGRCVSMKKKTFILLGFILAKFILQYNLISPAYDLQRDEFLHLDQGKHLAWGYISVPPVTSWISYIIQLLGKGVFWVKFFPALFGALTMLLVWKIIDLLKGNLFALTLGLLAVLLSVMLRINILYQPNSLDIFFWTFLYYTLIQYIHTNNTNWFFGAALAIGFGILSKYNIVFLILGLLPALLLTPHRNILWQKKFFISLAIAFFIVLPNIIWQFQNDFPTISQLKELERTQLVNVNTSAFLKDQFIYFLVAMPFILCGFMAFFVYEPFKKYRVIFWSYLFTILLFIFFHAKSYYAAGLYPVLIAFGTVYTSHLLTNGWKRILQPFAFIWILCLGTFFISVAFPYKSPQEIEQNSQRYKDFGLLRWEDGKDHNLPQDFADMIGWSELAKKVDSVYTNIPNKANTLVLCDNYGQAGAINYYSTFKNINAVSLNADYINWIPLDKPIINVILIQNADDDDPERKQEIPLFTRVSLVGENTNPYSREIGTKIYLLAGAKTNINAILLQEINKYKAGY